MKTTWTVKTVKDSNSRNYFKYSFENENEKEIIKQNSTIELITDTTIYYYIDNRKLLKIKLLCLINNNFKFIINKILKNSIATNMIEILIEELYLESEKYTQK